MNYYLDLFMAFLVGLIIGTIIGEIRVWWRLQKKFKIPWSEFVGDKLTIKKDD